MEQRLRGGEGGSCPSYPFPSSRNASSRLRDGGFWFAPEAGLRCAFDPLSFFTPQRALVRVRVLSKSPFLASRKEVFSRLRVGGVWFALVVGLRSAFGPAHYFLEKGILIIRVFVKGYLFYLSGMHLLG